MNLAFFLGWTLAGVGMVWGAFAFWAWRAGTGIRGRAVGVADGFRPGRLHRRFILGHAASAAFVSAAMGLLHRRVDPGWRARCAPALQRP